MKLKYINERIEPYFIFGTSGDKVDLATASNPTIVSNISQEDAELLIKQRDEVIEMLHKLSEACPVEFEELFYLFKEQYEKNI